MSVGSRTKSIVPFVSLTLAFVTCLQLCHVASQVIDCQSIIMKVAKGIVKLYGICSKELMAELNSNAKEFNRRVDCVLFCVMDRIGVLDEYQKVTNDSMQVFFDKFIPEDYHEIGQIMIEGCIDEYAPLMTLDDELCQAYGDYIRCVQNVVAEAC